MTPSLPRFAGVAAAVLAGVCALGFLPTRSAAGMDGLVAMAVAAALVYVGALLGYLPLLSRHARTGPEGLANAFLIGLGVRLFFTLAGVLVFGMGMLPARAAFLLWAGIGYAVILVVEILQLVRTLSPTASIYPAGSPAGGAPSDTAVAPLPRQGASPRDAHQKGSATA